MTEEREDVRCVLVERLATYTQGKTIWFRQMTAIGPMSTPFESERHIFPSRSAAKRCPAMYHVLSAYEIFELD